MQHFFPWPMSQPRADFEFKWLVTIKMTGGSSHHRGENGDSLLLSEYSVRSGAFHLKQ
jgi:hypothetical protein